MMATTTALESPALPSLPPTPPPKDVLDSAPPQSLLTNGHAKTPGVTQHTGSSYFASKPNAEPVITTTTTTNEPGPGARPVLRIGTSFARPVPPTLTITPIATITPTNTSGPDADAESNAYDRPASNSGVSARKALRALSGSRVSRSLLRRASLPASPVVPSPALSQGIVSRSHNGHDAQDGTTDESVVLSASPVTFEGTLDREVPQSNLSHSVQRCMHAMLELVDSEKAFVADLQTLLRYTTALASPDNDLSLSEAQSSVAASLNVVELLRIHETLSKQFEDVKHSISKPDADEAVIASLSEISRAFNGFDSNRRVYESYCAGHGDLVDILRGVQHTPEYLAFEQRLASSSAPGSGSGSGLQPEDRGRHDRHKSLSSDGHSGGTSTWNRRQSLKARAVAAVSYSSKSDSGHGSTSTPVDPFIAGAAAPIPDEFGISTTNAAGDKGTNTTSVARTSLTSRPSFKSFRRSLRKSPSSSSSRWASARTSRAPSPDPRHTPSPSPTPSPGVSPSPSLGPTPSSSVSALPARADSIPPTPPDLQHASRARGDTEIPPVPPIPPSILIPSPSPFSPNTPTTASAPAPAVVEPSPNSTTTAYPLQAPTSKPLALRDLMIKPIQRVCRYPLLLAQMRLPPRSRSDDKPDSNLDIDADSTRNTAMHHLELAIKATRLVASNVDKAQELREIARKSALIVERLEPHAVVTQEFMHTLGHCLLASSVEATLHVCTARAGSSTQQQTVPKTKFVAAFVYRGYILLVKVRKNQTYRAWHWFPLQECTVEACGDDATPSNSFKLKTGEYEMEMMASCKDERLIWMKALLMAAQDRSPMVHPIKSSLQLLSELSAAQSAASSGAGGSTPKRRHSYFSSATAASSTNSSTSATTSATPRAGPSSTSAPSEGANVASSSATVTRTPTAIKRLSTASLASIFSPDQTVTPATPSRRSAPANRQLVDRNIRDVTSDVCLAARAQAQIQGELFQVPSAAAPARSRTSSQAQSQPPLPLPPPPPSVISAPALARRARKRQTIDHSGGSSSSFGLARMSEESQASGGRSRSSSSPTHRRVRSMPGIDPSLPPLPLLPNSVPPQPSSSTASSTAAEPSPDPMHTPRMPRRRTVFDLADDAPLSREDSEEGYADSGWEKDDAASAAYTDFSSVETHPGAGSAAGTTSSQKAGASESASPIGDDDEDECVVLFVGKGLTNVAQPPERTRSLFRKSLLALSRRRTRSSPSPVADEPRHLQRSPTPSRQHAQSIESIRRPANMPPSTEDGRLLSPHWTSGSRRDRSISPRAPGARFLPAERIGSTTPTSPRVRHAMDIDRR